jgi:hypothetical protein
VSIFRRGSKNEDLQQEQALDETGDQALTDTETTADETDERGGTGDGATEPDPTPEGEDGAGADRGTAGPFDASEVDLSRDDRLDLGALRIRGLPGMELRLEVDESGEQVVAATAVMGDSAVQLQAFAAPRTAGIWDGIRSEIAESIVAQGGTADEGWGELGRELRTRMPSAGPDGRTVFAPALFTGVDGPRWFLRAVFSGRAAIDTDAAAPLVGVVRDTVVVRGDAAMAPREMLLLTLPDQAGVAAEDDGEEPAPRADDLKPFERGPEITEVR